MTYKNPEWIGKIIELANNKEPPTCFCLNDLAFERLRECKSNSEGTISYKEVWSKLCRNFSIKKEDCKKLLRHFESIGKVKFVKQRGIRISV